MNGSVQFSDRSVLGRIVWETSRRDEGSVSAAGADIIADAILAAGFRRQGQITDAQVEAALSAYAVHAELASSHAMRAALEAAKEVS